MAPCTLVVVSYNHAPFVRECLDSLAAQTVSCPVLFVDDGSTDGTVSIARAYFEEHGIDATVIADGENHGLCRRLNEAVVLVDTEYYAYLSTDDTLAPNRVAAQLARFAELPGDYVAVYSDAYLMSPDGTRWPGTAADHVPVPQASEGHLFEQLLEATWIPTPTVMLRTDAVRRAGGYDESLPFEDHDMWLRLAKIGKFDRIDEPLASARQNADGSLTELVMVRDRTSWDLTKCQLLISHAGHSARGDEIIRERLRPVLPVLATSRERAPEVRRLLRRVTARLPDRRVWLLRVLAELRIARPLLGSYRRLRG